MSSPKKTDTKREPRPGEGRPTKYKPEYCQMLIEHGQEGFSFESFAGKILVNPDSLYEWCKKHPEFSEARKIARAAARYFLECDGKKLRRGDFGRDANTSAWIFTMRNIAGWRDQPVIDEDAVDGIEFVE